MQYLIGTDEAGYGPNLGPLVISASLWEVPEGVGGEDLYGRLDGSVVRLPSEAARRPDAAVAMADSKVLYTPGKGLRHLERGLWAALDLLERRPGTWRELFDALAPGAAEQLQAVPWYVDYDSPLPVDADLDRLQSAAAELRRQSDAGGVRLIDLCSRVILPGVFNQLLDRHRSKGAALSHQTIDLVARLIGPLGERPIGVICDKHGGRNRYAPLLSAHFPDRLVEIHGEGRQLSVYRFGPAQRRIEFRFQTKAEAHLPAALASMASKYLRELAMRAFNAFWSRQVDGLKPTAGYPQDARRFKAQIAERQEEIGIDDRILWRVK